MFEHRRFGLEQAVIARQKEMARRRVRFPKGINDRGTWERNEWQFAYQFKLIK